MLLSKWREVSVIAATFLASAGWIQRNQFLEKLPGHSKPPLIPYSDFIKNAAKDAFTSVTIDGKNLSIVGKDGKKYSSRAPDGNNVTERLLNTDIIIEAEAPNSPLEIPVNWGPPLIALYYAIEFIRERKTNEFKQHEPKDENLISKHEIGHTLIAVLTDNTNYLQYVTCLGQAGSSGHMSYDQKNNLSDLLRQKIMNDFAITLGGRAAEKMCFGNDNFSPGAASDIREATEMARHLITKAGMSLKLGPVDYTDPNLSDITKREVELEIRKFILEAEDSAVKMLTEHHDKFDLLDEELQRCKTLSRAEIYKLLNMQDPEPPSAAKKHWFDRFIPSPN